MEEVNKQIILEETYNRFLLAQQYLTASKNLLDLMIENNNKRVYIRKVTDGKNANIDEIFENLKNSSIFTIIPTIFSFYQGLELIIKAFVLIANPDLKLTHNIKLCFKEFAKIYTKEKEIISLCEKYLNESDTSLAFLKQFQEDNNIRKSTELYNALRYPEGNENNIKSIDYCALKYYDNKQFIPQIKQLSDDIETLIKYSVKLHRKSKFI